MENSKKLLKNGFVKKENFFFLNGKTGFETKNKKIVAFLPKIFTKFKNLIWTDEVAFVPFEWKNNIPCLRFKVEIKKIENDFLNEYKEYLFNLEYKHNQIRFHIIPSFILKKWKGKNEKIYDTKNKKILNYDERYFMLNVQGEDLYFFVEEFSSKVENFISIVYKKRPVNDKTKTMLNFIDILFSSRNQYFFGLTELHNNDFSKIETIDYKGTQKDKILQYSLSLATALSGKPIVDTLGFDVKFNGISIITLPKEFPLTNINYFFFNIGKLICGGFLINPKQLMVFSNIEIKHKWYTIINNEFIKQCYKDKRVRWILYNNKTDKKILNGLKNNEYINPEIIAW